MENSIIKSDEKTEKFNKIPEIENILVVKAITTQNNLQISVAPTKVINDEGVPLTKLLIDEFGEGSNEHNTNEIIIIKINSDEKE